MISIIIPMYNAEMYLEECLLSIQNQTYKDFECIIVNDGSTDLSPEIAQKFVDSDLRFKLIHQKNSGSSVARNNGIKAATGEYLTMVDNDDCIDEHFLETLLSYFRDGVDIVECRYNSNARLLGQKSNESIKILFEGKGKEALHALVIDKLLAHSPWAKIYRTQLFDDAPYPENLNYEDLYMYLLQLRRINKIVKLDYVGYFYRKNEHSIINSAFSDRNLEMFPLCDKIEALYVDDKESQPLVYRHLFACMVYHYLNYIEKDNPYKAKYEEYLKKYAAKAQNSGISLRVYKLCPKYFKPLMLLLGKVKNIKGI